MVKKLISLLFVGLLAVSIAIPAVAAEKPMIDRACSYIVESAGETGAYFYSPEELLMYQEAQGLDTRDNIVLSSAVTPRYIPHEFYLRWTNTSYYSDGRIFMVKNMYQCKWCDENYVTTQIY